VPGTPYFQLIDATDGAVLGEGSAANWSRLTGDDPPAARRRRLRPDLRRSTRERLDRLRRGTPPGGNRPGGRDALPEAGRCMTLFAAPPRRRRRHPIELVAMRGIDAVQHPPARRAGTRQPMVRDVTAFTRVRPGGAAGRWELVLRRTSANSIPGELALIVLVGALALSPVASTCSASALRVRRQVNERWIGNLRGTVYGFGFGAQLGSGISHVHRHLGRVGGTRAELLSGSAVTGAMVGAVFGWVRAIAPLAAGWIDRPSRLTRSTPPWPARRPVHVGAGSPPR
jgi:hypothetical protein